MMTMSIFLISILSLFGWIENNTILTCWNHSFVSMEPTTAIMFILTAFILFLMTGNHDNKYSKHLITLFSGWISVGIIIILLLIATSSYLQIDSMLGLTLIPDLNPYTVYSYMPSAMSLFCFFLVSIAGILYVFNTHRVVKRLQCIGISLMIIGGVACIGYILSIPTLFYYTELGSNGMALNTACCMTLTGYLFYRIANKIKKK